jgi:hypothetical protein
MAGKCPPRLYSAQCVTLWSRSARGRHRPPRLAHLPRRPDPTPHPELAIYVALFGFRFQIHQPPELIAHIRDLATRLTDATRDHNITRVIP